MGSSHFVNSCGSLWGIERTKEGHSTFYAGTQRLSGTAHPMAVDMDDDGWFLISNDFDRNFKLFVHTDQRKRAWEALPSTFTYSEARKATELIMKSKNSFTPFWNGLKRLKLVLPERWLNGSCKSPAERILKSRLRQILSDDESKSSGDLRRKHFSRQSFLNYLIP